MEAVYMDHAASSPLHPQVLEHMLPFLAGVYGNPSSLHRFGREARAAITQSRDKIASLLRADSRGVLFTSGGTESDNLAIFGVCGYPPLPEKRHFVTSQIEHHAVLHTCERLESLGYEVTYVPVDSTGLVLLDELKAALRSDTALISIMYANNEVGTIQPIPEIAELAKEKDVLLHVDAVQAAGKLPIDFAASGIDFLSLSAHKFNGPRGAGALICSSSALSRLHPLLYGGNQERKRRAGTENVAAIVGMAKALELALERMDETAQTDERYRDQFLQTLGSELPVEGFVVNGHPVKRLPGILNVSFPGISTESMLMNLDLAGIAAASGSACTSGSLELSHVLRAMRLPEETAASAVRFSFGLGNTVQQIHEAATAAATIAKRLRRI